MFIVTNNLASQGWDKVQETVTEPITRYGGEIVRLRKWSERSFAYPIQKHESGVYVLVQFRSNPQDVSKIEGRVQITPEILRVLITRIEERYAEESFAKEPGDEEITADGEDMEESDESDEMEYEEKKSGEEEVDGEEKEESGMESLKEENEE